MKYLSHYTGTSQTELFNKTGSFFAFSDAQFYEKMDRNLKYKSLGSGLICPAENVVELLEGLENIRNLGIKKDVEENGVKKIIEREYFNYETQITGDKSDVLSALEEYKKLFPNLFTEELIKETCKDCYNLAVENDWF